jgi:hypothetical protein
VLYYNHIANQGLMNLNIAIISLLSITSQYHADSSVHDYLELFRSDAKRFGVTLVKSPPAFIIEDRRLSIIINHEKIKVEAYRSGNTIYFDSGSFMYQNNLKVLVYHELGHYYLNRDDNEKVSIMNVDFWGTSWGYWDELPPEDQTLYLKELFKK